MRLCRLNLTRYGHFTDFTIDLGDSVKGRADFHIILGENEAGKSTAFNGYLDLLFGIEERSKYNFLHDYSLLRVGALIEFEGKRVEVARVKRRDGSLIDSSGNPLGEGFLSSVLHGLSRDSYRAMFSLDDETLELGGEEILASKGDLGRLLFAGTAGVADLSVELAKLREKANKLYAERTRSHEIFQLRQELELLDREKKALDTQAKCYELLTEACKRGDGRYEAARRRSGELRREAVQLAAMKRAFPLWNDLQKQEQQLAAFDKFLPIPTEWQSELCELQKRSAAAEEKRESSLIEIESVEKELASCLRDPAILAVGGELEALEELYHRYRAAIKELPSLSLKLKEAEETIDLLRKRAGIDVEIELASCVVADDAIGELESLLIEEGELSLALKNADKELADAEEALHEAKECKNEGDFPQEAMRLLSVLCDKAIDSDVEGRVKRGERFVAEVRDEITKVLKRLPGSCGDYKRLQSLLFPTPSQIEGWNEKQLSIEKSGDKIRGRLAEERERLVSLAAKEKVLLLQVAIFSDEKAKEARLERDKAWEEHCQRLEKESLKAFEKALAADDKIRDERLHLAERLAELRAVAVERAEREAQLTLLDEMMKEVEEKSVDLQSEMEILLVEIGLPITTSPKELGETLGEIEAVIALAEKEDRALAELSQVRKEEEEIGGELFQALQAVGEKPTQTLEIKRLLSLAKIARENAIKEEERRSAAAESRARRELERARRRRALKSAENAFCLWKERWERTLEPLWFREKSAAQIRALIVPLRQIVPLLSTKNSLIETIFYLERERDLFISSLEVISSSLKESPIGECAKYYTLLKERLVEAKRVEASIKMAQSRKEMAERRLEEAKSLLLSIDRRRQVMACHLPNGEEITTLDKLAIALEGARKKVELQEAVAEKERQLFTHLAVKSRGDAENMLLKSSPCVVEEKIAELEVELAAAESELEDAIEERRDALRAIEEIGGDAVVARLAEKQKSLLLEIESKASRALSLHLGLMAADRALVLYRDRHRSELLQNTQKAFAAITSGQFIKLSTETLPSGEQLVAVRKNGRSIAAEEMSKGTRFQLYLALRLAGYRRFCSSFGPLPFIGDDIMETFDDRRSKAALQQLSDIAKTGQALYFTHHRHLCDLAREACGDDVTIHEIPRS